MTHHVKQAKFPGWIGTDQLRHYSLEGDRLILRTPPVMRDGSEWIITVVWGRLPPGARPTENIERGRNDD